MLGSWHLPAHCPPVSPLASWPSAAAQRCPIRITPSASMLVKYRRAGALARSFWSGRSGQLPSVPLAGLNSQRPAAPWPAPFQSGHPGPLPSVPLAGRQSPRPANASVLRRAFRTSRISSIDSYAP
eukprot:2381242-Rhodomonas_salina.1